MHMHQRRPPLLDLPLEQFLLPDDNVPSPHRVSKRPLSPGGTRRSPAKRRIVAIEGVCSPQKSSENHDPSSPRRRRSSRRLSAALKGADSPSKKLDFGRLSVSRAAGEDMRRENGVGHYQVTTAALAPPPELRLNNGNSLTSLAAPHAHVNAFEGEVLHTYVVGRVAGQSSSEPSATDSTPHEITPDHQSPHYPGFDVYRDCRVAEKSTDSSQDMDVDTCGSADDSQLDLVAMRRETEKENIQPRGARGSMGPPALPGEAAWAKAGLLPPAAHRKLQDVRGRPRFQRCSMA